jgi:hypothetical protein
MNTFQTIKKDKIDTASSNLGDFTKVDDAEIIQRTFSNSFGRYTIKSLNKTIVIRGKGELKIPYNAEKEKKESENILVNRGPQPSSPSHDETE